MTIGRDMGTGSAIDIDAGRCIFDKPGFTFGNCVFGQ